MKHIVWLLLLITNIGWAQVTIQPTPFWVKVYRGYPTATYTMTLPASLSATVVTDVLYYGEGKLALPAPAQPTLSRTGNNVTITYPNVPLLPTTAYQEIKFDGVKTLVGTLTTSYAFAGIPQNQSTTITLSGGTTVTVSVLGSGGGGSSGVSSFTALTDRPTTLSGYGITNAYTQTQINSLLSAKAGVATTLSGYGISDAYTITQIDNLLSGKAATATTLAGYGITNAYTKTEVDNALLGKVSVVAGKGLSTEDYTTAEKTKLAGLSNFNLTLTTTGSSGPATYANGTLNIPQYGGGGGGGDMSKATYDQDGDNIVDQAEAAPWSGVSGKPSFASVATSGAYTDLTGRPSLATVATSGAYTDLSGRPTLGTAAALNVAASGNAATGEVVKGNDTRLTDARTPTAHTQTASTITDFQTTVSANTDVSANTTARHSHTNKALLDTYDQTNANLTDAVSKRHTHSNQSVLDNTTASFTTADESKVDALGTASTKNVPTSGNAAAGEVVLGSDTRLTDARTPVTHTHTKSQITDFSHTHSPADITTDASNRFVTDAQISTWTGKQNTITLTTTGTSGAATFNSSTGALNIPNYATGGGGGSSVSYQKITATATITPSADQTVIAVDNGSTAVAVNIDPATTIGQIVVVKRYDSNSTANVQINATGTALMQNTGGSFGDGILLPTGSGTRQWAFVWNGVNYELISQ